MWCYLDCHGCWSKNISFSICTTCKAKDATEQIHRSVYLPSTDVKNHHRRKGCAWGSAMLCELVACTLGASQVTGFFLPVPVGYVGTAGLHWCWPLCEPMGLQIRCRCFVVSEVQVAFLIFAEGFPPPSILKAFGWVPLPPCKLYPRQSCLRGHSRSWKLLACWSREDFWGGAALGLGRSLQERESAYTVLCLCVYSQLFSMPHASCSGSACEFGPVKISFYIIYLI